MNKVDLVLMYSETFDVHGASPERLERNGGRIMEALLDLEGGVDRIMDSAVSTDAEAMTITLEFAMLVPADLEPEQALIGARSVARTAIHATGGHTPGWDPSSVSREHELTNAA